MTEKPNQGHSRLAPSSASRWTVCTASPAFIEANQHLIVDRSSDYADEGTIAHHWAKQILLGLADLSEIQAGEHTDGEVTITLTEDQAAEMREAVGDYTTHCRRLSDIEGTQVFVEERVPLFYLPEDGGTVDFAAITDKAIRIRDLKYGKGVIVEARENKQLAIYAWSLICDLQESGLYDFPEDLLVDIGVCQPRTHDEKPIKLWATTVGDLRQFVAEIDLAAYKIRLVEAGLPLLEGETLVFAPSDSTCQFCPAKGFCEARKAELSNPLPFDIVGALPDLSGKKQEPSAGVDILTDEQIAKIIENRKAVSKWMDDIHDYAEARAQDGKPVVGTKLVAGREGNRAWADEEAADKLIAKFLPANERYKPKVLISPTQADKKLEPHKAEFSTRFSNRLDSLIVRPSGKPTLVLESDPRPSIIQPAAEVLPNEEEDPLA